MSDYSEVVGQALNTWDESGTAGTYFDVATEKWTEITWLALREMDGTLNLAIGFRADGEDDCRIEIAGEYGGSLAAATNRVMDELAKPAHEEDGWRGLPIKSTRGGDLYVSWHPYDAERYIITFEDDEGTRLGGIDPQDGTHFVQVIESAALGIIRAVAENP